MDTDVCNGRNANDGNGYEDKGTVLVFSLSLSLLSLVVIVAFVDTGVNGKENTVLGIGIIKGVNIGVLVLV